MYCGCGEQADTHDGQVRYGLEDGEQNEVEGAMDEISSTAALVIQLHLKTPTVEPFIVL